MNQTDKASRCFRPRRKAVPPVRCWVSVPVMVALVVCMLSGSVACTARPDAGDTKEPSPSVLPSRIIEAIRQDDVGMVSDWLSKDREGVNAVCPIGRTALFYAAVVPDSRVLPVLLEHGAAPGFRDPEGVTPLFCAVPLKGNISNVRRMLEAGADAQRDGTSVSESPGECHVLSAIIGVADIELAKLLLDYGASPTALDGMGSTPLHSAAGSGDLEYAKLYIAYSDGNVDPRDGSGQTPALLAAMATTFLPSMIDVVRAFVEAGADLSASVPEGTNAGTTVAMYLLEEFGDEVEDVVRKALLESSHKVDQQCGLGFTLLHYAARSDAVRVIQFLSDAGGDLNLQGHLGQTPLHLAARAEAVEAVRVLLNLGAETRVRNELGATPRDSTQNSKIRGLLD